MGKATRWLRGLLGMKKDNEKNNSNVTDKKEKKKRSTVKNSDGLNQNIPATHTAWLRSYIAESENKHAIAVAAATAAAADAAIAAAQVAVAVVRMTSHGGGGLFADGRERWAAVKVQAVFKGYLARKALRALRGLVKLQANVRGYLVRKRAAATLHSMQALIRAQAAVRSQRARLLFNADSRFQAEMRARNSNERFIETRSEFHSKRFSAPYDSTLNALDQIPKIVEINSCGPKSSSRRFGSCMSEYGEDQYYQVISSPLPCRVPNLSIPHCRHCKDFNYEFVEEDYKYATAHNTPRFACSGWANAPVTPAKSVYGDSRFACSGQANAPVTPAKSVYGDSFFRPYPNSPNYMTNTQSFRAKLRSHSAPKQRPETGPMKRLSLNEIMASRTSFSGVRVQRSCTPS